MTVSKLLILTSIFLYHCSNLSLPCSCIKSYCATSTGTSNQYSEYSSTVQWYPDDFLYCGLWCLQSSVVMLPRTIILQLLPKYCTDIVLVPVLDELLVRPSTTFVRTYVNQRTDDCFIFFRENSVVASSAGHQASTPSSPLLVVTVEVD